MWVQRQDARPAPVRWSRPVATTGNRWIGSVRDKHHETGVSAVTSGHSPYDGIPPATDPDRLFPADVPTRQVARELFADVEHAPIISVHGHVDVSLIADDRPFADAASLLVTPDHYVTRLLHANGAPMEQLRPGP